MVAQVIVASGVAIWVGAASYVHFRGRVRHKLTRQLTDHSTLMAPYNVLTYFFSAVPNTPVLDPRAFPELGRLQANWEAIREEAAQLYEAGHIAVAAKYNDISFNTFFKRGWKRFYLKWYGDFMPSARKLCPRTVALVESIPSVHAALFAYMAPHSRLGEHRDPFGGSLRYHLGVITPNSPMCRISVDGQEHYWKDGEALLFDETFIHSARNDTDQPRIILFCDVERPIRNSTMRAINRFMCHSVVKISQAQNNEQERVGALNWASSGIYSLKLLFTRLKGMNRTLYYCVKYLLLAALLYWFIVALFSPA